MKRTRSTVLAAATASALTLTLTACGGDADGSDDSGGFKPRGDVTMLVPFGAGGGSDLAGRATATMIEAAEKDVTVTVENREGGSGAVGYSYFLGQQGNENLLLASETALLALPISGEVEFDYTDFTPIMKLGDDYTLRSSRPTARTRAAPTSSTRPRRTAWSPASAASRGWTTSSSRSLEQETGAKFDRVPFESGGELTAALLGGQIDVASLNPGEIIGQLKSGDVKALCAYSEERYSDYEELADIETAKEQGIDVAFAQFRGVIAPGGISDEARDYWIDTMKAAVKTDKYQQYIEDNYLQANSAAGDDFVEYLKGNDEQLKKVLAG